jgi:hypothetical protein
MDQPKAWRVPGRHEPRDKREEAWRAIFREQAGSGLSHSDFCRERSIPPYSYFWYRRRLEWTKTEAAQRSTAGQKKPSTLVPVRISASSRSSTAPGAIEVVLARGRIPLGLWDPLGRGGLRLQHEPRIRAGTPATVVRSVRAPAGPGHGRGRGRVGLIAIRGPTRRPSGGCRWPDAYDQPASGGAPPGAVRMRAPICARPVRRAGDPAVQPGGRGFHPRPEADRQIIAREGVVNSKVLERIQPSSGAGRLGPARGSSDPGPAGAAEAGDG